jgi:hypothetical protein
VEGIYKGAKLNHLLSRIIILIGIVFFLGTLVYSYENSVVHIGSGVKTILVLLSAMILVLLAAHALTRWLTKAQFLFVLILIAIGLRLAWILYINTPPISDFMDMRNAALKAANGDFSFGHNEYFSRWVYLLGFTMYEAFLTKLFGDSLMVLKLFNIVFNVGTAVVIYFAASKVFNEFCGRIAALLYAIYVPNIIMCSVLTNQHLSTFLFALGCLLAIRGGLSTKYYWIWIGILFALGNMIRPLGIFFVIGVVIFGLISILLLTAIGERRRILVRIVGVAAVYFIAAQTISYAFISSGLTNYPFKSQEPYWKFMVGLNQKTVGGWSQEDTDYVLQYKLGTERNNAELNQFKQRLQDPGLMNLLSKKFTTMWGSEDSSVMWSLWEINKPDLARLLTQTEKIIYTAMSVFALASLIALFWKNNYPTHTLFLILLIGYAAVHIIIEIQTRYRFDILPSLMIIQSFGIYFVYSFVSSLFNKQPISIKQ